jgi:hypothetical protein
VSGPWTLGATHALDPATDDLVTAAHDLSPRRHRRGLGLRRRRPLQPGGHRPGRHPQGRHHGDGGGTPAWTTPSPTRCRPCSPWAARSCTGCLLGSCNALRDIPRLVALAQAGQSRPGRPGHRPPTARRHQPGPRRPPHRHRRPHRHRPLTAHRAGPPGVHGDRGSEHHRSPHDQPRPQPRRITTFGAPPVATRPATPPTPTHHHVRGTTGRHTTTCAPNPDASRRSGHHRSPHHHRCPQPRRVTTFGAPPVATPATGAPNLEAREVRRPRWSWWWWPGPSWWARPARAASCGGDDRSGPLDLLRQWADHVALDGRRRRRQSKAASSWAISAACRSATVRAGSVGSGRGGGGGAARLGPSDRRDPAGLGRIGELPSSRIDHHGVGERGALDGGRARRRRTASPAPPAGCRRPRPGSRSADWKLTITWLELGRPQIRCPTRRTTARTGSSCRSARSTAWPASHRSDCPAGTGCGVAARHGLVGLDVVGRGDRPVGQLAARHLRTSVSWP